jgi:hypothetical protein
MIKYGIRAVFLDEESKEAGSTYFNEVTFNSEEEALSAINGTYGDELLQASVIDSQTEEDLIGLVCDDLKPYAITEEN